MKTLAIFAIFVLAFGTASTSLVNEAYAQDNPDILLRIAVQADKQISNQLDGFYGDSIPSDILALYEKGHAAAVSLENSLSDDVEQAKEDFLTAMKSFKQITRIISEPNAESRLTASDVSDSDLKSKLNRLDKYFQNLKTASEKHNTGIEFSEIQQLFTQAHQQIDSGETNAASETIHQLELVIDEIKKKIREHSSHSTSDRVKEFALKHLVKIQEILEDPSIDPDMPELEKANSLVTEIETLISEDQISNAKKKFGELNKIVKIIKNSIR